MPHTNVEGGGEFSGIGKNKYSTWWKTLKIFLQYQWSNFYILISGLSVLIEKYNANIINVIQIETNIIPLKKFISDGLNALGEK